jgi:F5/8 type C domain/Right handed beta helix region
MLPLLGHVGSLVSTIATTLVAATGSVTSTGELTTAGAQTTAARPGATYYVAGSGPRRCSDSYTLTQARHPQTPWCRIGIAATRVGAGSRVLVASGVYHETVTLLPNDDGVTLQGIGSSKPILTGDNVRPNGIVLANGVRGVTIADLDIRDLSAPPSGRAAAIAGLDTANDEIRDCVIHGVHGTGPYSYGIVLGDNDRPGVVHDVTVDGNRIYDIGPGGESMGIWLLSTTRITVERNEIYLVRKEGIRDWVGVDNVFKSNRVYLVWAGLTIEESVGDIVTNNLSYANVWGYDAKHVADARVLAVWHLRAPDWTWFIHNTAYGNTHAAFGLGENAPDANYLAIEDNIFGTSGDVDIHDFPEVRGDAIVLDGNIYSGSAPLYYSGWSSHRTPITTLAALRATLSWEQNGQMARLKFGDPHMTDLPVDRNGLKPGVTLPDPLANQVGAVDAAPASTVWTRYPATVATSTLEPSYLRSSDAIDGSDDSIWWSTTKTGSLTFDLGSVKRVNTFVLDLFEQSDPRAPRRYTIQVSDDSLHYRTALAGSNPDSEGSSFKYVLGAPVNARYVRLNLLSTFGAPTVLFADFQIGLLSPRP